MTKEKTLRIGLVSDIHYGLKQNTRAGNQGSALLHNAINVFNTQELDLVVDLGDRIGAQDSLKDSQCLEELALAFSQSKHSLVHLIGNHDVYNLTYSQNSKILGCKVTSWTKRIGEYLLIFFNPRLDEVRRMHFVLREDDLSWLEHALINADAPTIIFSHIPLMQGDLRGNFYFERAWAGGATFVNQHEIRAVIEKSGFCIMNVAGHVHWDSLTTTDGIHIVTIPSLTETFQTPHTPVNATGILTITQNTIQVDIGGVRPITYRLPIRSHTHWINMDVPYATQPQNLSEEYETLFLTPHGKEVGETSKTENTLTEHQELLARIGWMYYVDQITQQEMSERLGIPRPRIVKLLQEALYQGIVQIRINTPSSDVIELERQLCDIYQLNSVRLLPSLDQSKVNLAAGKVAGEVIANLLSPSDSLAVAWGSTLMATAKELYYRDARVSQVISATGGLPQNSEISPSNVALRFANVLQADCLIVNAPMFVERASLRKHLVESTVIKHVLEEAKRANVWLINAVDLERLNSLQNLTFSPEVLVELRQTGVVGLLGGYLMKINGQLATHQLNDCLIAPPLSDMCLIPTKVLVAAGISKSSIIHSALSSGAVDIFISDVTTAREVLKNFRSLHSA